MSVPKTMPSRSGSTGLEANPASLQARSAATNANRITRLISLRALRGRTYCSAWRSSTWAPIAAGKSLPLNSPSERTPLRPLHSEVQNCSHPIPIGLTTPIPVMTTSRVGAMLYLPPSGSSDVDAHSGHAAIQNCRGTHPWRPTRAVAPPPYGNPMDILRIKCRLRTRDPQTTGALCLP